MKLTLLLASLAALAVGYRVRDARKRQREAAIDGFLGQMRAMVAAPIDEGARRRAALVPPVTSDLRITIIQHAKRRGVR